MVTPEKLIDPIQLANAVAVVYTCPANTRAILKKVVCANNDTGPGAQALTFYMVPSGGSPGVTNIVLPTAVSPLKTAEIYELENAVLKPGDTLQGFATTAAKVTIHLSGVLVGM